MRHKTGVWNAIWSDMFIETTFMRYGHGPAGLVGITPSPRALKRWVLSLHTCSRLLKDLDVLREVREDECVTTHKEESDTRITSDAVERNKLRDKLDTCISHINPQGNDAGNIVNIATGKISPDSVNVDDAVSICRKQMTMCESSWPEGFNGTLSSSVVTLAAGKKGVKCGSGTVYDMQLIYARVMGLLSTRQYDLKDLFRHELAQLPTSLFDDNGNMRPATSKSVLKQKLQINTVS